MDEMIARWQMELKAAYDHDACNRQRQSWPEYWQAYRQFMVDGTPAVDSWLVSMDRMLPRVGDEAARRQIHARLLHVGKQVAAEWAKDTRCRRIRTTRWQLAEAGKPAAQDWKALLEQAVKADTGDGRRIEAALSTIEWQLHEALGV